MKIVELDSALLLTRLEEVKTALANGKVNPDMLTLGALIVLSERLGATHGVLARLSNDQHARTLTGVLSPMPKTQQ